MTHRRQLRRRRALMQFALALFLIPTLVFRLTEATDQLKALAHALRELAPDV